MLSSELSSWIRGARNDQFPSWMTDTDNTGLVYDLSQCPIVQKSRSGWASISELANGSWIPVSPSWAAVLSLSGSDDSRLKEAGLIGNLERVNYA